VRVERARAAARPITIDHVWAFVALTVPIMGVLASSMSTIDLTYQVRAGDWMLRTHQVLDVDTFTFTVHGAPWLNQQWLAQVMLAALYRAWGWAGVSVARGVLTGVSLAAIFLACRHAGASLRRAALLTTAGFLLAQYHMAMRPQMIGFALFCVSLWLLEGRRERPRSLWFLPVIVAIWANIHGSFVLGPLLGGLAWLEDRRDRSPVARTTFFVTAAACLATLLNPFGWRVLSYTVQIGTNSTIRNLISEWRPTTITMGAGAAFFGSVAAIALYFARTERTIPWLTLLRLGIFFVLALPAIRGVMWWAAAAPVAVAGILPPAKRASRVGIPTMNLLIVLLLAASLVIAIPRNGLTVIGDPILRDAPEGLVAAIRTQLPPGSRMFASQVWGSWFEFANPSQLVFVDARIELYSPQIWSDYFNVSGARQGWEGILNRWSVDAVVLDPQQSGPLVDWIRTSPDWDLGYQDADGYLFVRAEP
jgi:hypothetical protein